MKRERLTRAQRKEQTLERLLEAARTMFVKKGFAATSVEDIAGAAGYTRGAFYSNFDGKPELLLELMRRDHDRAQTNLRAMMEEGGTREQIKARATTYYSRHFLDYDGFPLWVEATLLACRDAGFQKRLNAFRHERLDHVSACIRALSERDGRQVLLQADALALGVLSLSDGMQLSRMCDPQMMSNEVMQTVIAGFFSCVLMRQSEEMRRADHRASVSDGGGGRPMPTVRAGNIHD